MSKWRPGDRVWHIQLRQHGTVVPAMPDSDTTTVKFDGENEARRVSTIRLIKSPDRRKKH